jgi:hypothetical protein
MRTTALTIIIMASANAINIIGPVTLPEANVRVKVATNLAATANLVDFSFKTARQTINCANFKFTFNSSFYLYLSTHNRTYLKMTATTTTTHYYA